MDKLSLFLALLCIPLLTVCQQKFIYADCEPLRLGEMFQPAGFPPCVCTQDYKNNCKQWTAPTTSDLIPLNKRFVKRDKTFATGELTLGTSLIPFELFGTLYNKLSNQIQTHSRRTKPLFMEANDATFAAYFYWVLDNNGFQCPKANSTGLWKAVLKGDSGMLNLYFVSYCKWMEKKDPKYLEQKLQEIVKLHEYCLFSFDKAAVEAKIKDVDMRLPRGDEKTKQLEELKGLLDQCTKPPRY